MLSAVDALANVSLLARPCFMKAGGVEDRPDGGNDREKSQEAGRKADRSRQRDRQILYDVWFTTLKS